VSIQGSQQNEVSNAQVRARWSRNPVPHHHPQLERTSPAPDPRPKFARSHPRRLCLAGPHDRSHLDLRHDRAAERRSLLRNPQADSRWDWDSLLLSPSVGRWPRAPHHDQGLPALSPADTGWTTKPRRFLLVHPGDNGTLRGSSEEQEGQEDHEIANQSGPTQRRAAHFLFILFN